MLETQDGWPPGLAYHNIGLRLSISPPMLIGRRKTFFWYPYLARLANGEVLAVVNQGADSCEDNIKVPQAYTWSGDGGRSWTPAREFHAHGCCSDLTLPSEDLLLLPFNLFSTPQGVRGPCARIPKGRREALFENDRIEVTGWPRPLGHYPAPEIGGACQRLGLAGFFFNRQTLSVEDGRTYLATLYGTFAGDEKYSLVAAESGDGFHWKIRSVIAGARCPCGMFGPCEAALARLADGRLLCVFGQARPFRQCWSSDEGKTWTAPAPMAGNPSTDPDPWSDQKYPPPEPGPFSVMPSMAALKSGTVALSSGRPGLYLWLNFDRKGLAWRRIDLQAHHNACHPDEPLVRHEDANYAAYGFGSTTSNTALIALDERHLLVAYDRTPLHWPCPPAESTDPRNTFSSWVVRVRLDY